MTYRDVVFICDGQVPTCEKIACYLNGGDCMRTTDISHAKSFAYDLPTNSYVEKDYPHRSDQRKEPIVEYLHMEDILDDFADIAEDVYRKRTVKNVVLSGVGGMIIGIALTLTACNKDKVKRIFS